MHVVIRDIFHIGSVSVMSESSEASPVEICCQWSVASNETIYSHIKLLSSNQQGVNDIPLDDIRLCLRTLWLPSEIILPLSNLLKFVEEKNTFALRLCYGLHNPYTTHCFLEFLYKQGIVTWEVISCWEENVSLSFFEFTFLLQLLLIPFQIFNH
jgi:hypothetical protein